MNEQIHHSYETEVNENDSFFNNYSKKLNYIIPIGIAIFIIFIAILLITQRNSSSSQNNLASTVDSQFNTLSTSENNQQNVKGEKTSTPSGQIVKSPSPSPKKSMPTPKITPEPTSTPTPTPTPIEMPTPEPTPSPSPTPTEEPSPSPTQEP